MTKASDKMLVQAVLRGEKSTFGELYDRYAPLIRAVCYDKTGSLVEAQDLAQDVFIRAYENLGRLRNHDCLGKWLIGIARLRCKEWRRKNTRVQNEQAQLTQACTDSVEQSNDGQLQQLRETIMGLPEKERLVLHMFYLQGDSVDDARKIMGLSRSGFYRVLERARNRLKRLMSQRQEAI